MTPSAKTSLRTGIAAYLLCLLGPVAYKVLGHPAFSWWLALVAIWFPIAFSLVVLVLKLVLNLLRRGNHRLL